MAVSARLAASGKDETRLAAEYPWVYRWPVEHEALVDRLATLETDDPLREARAAAARDMFRGHDTLQAAVASFDLALDSVRWRKTRLPVRWAYELSRTFPWLYRRVISRAGRRRAGA